MHDVVVVGAGPAGLYASLLLAKGGADVVVVEEHDQVGVPTHCTGVISGEVHELFKLPEEIILHRPSSCLLVAPNGHTCELRSAREEIAVLDRAGLDRALATAAEEAGVALALGLRVENLRVTADRVELTTAGGLRLHARVVVLACGVAYRFHRSLGLGVPEAVLHTAQLELDGAPADALEIHLGRRIAPDGFAWVVPVQREGRARLKVGAILRGHAEAHLRAFLASSVMAARVAETPGRPVRRLLPVAPTACAHGDRVLAVGDAAGVTKPVTGGGIFYSLLSSAYAAETLLDALAQKDLSARRLAGYEQRWRHRLMPEIRTGAWFRRLLVRLSDAELDQFVEALASVEVQTVLRLTARFNWHRPTILALLRQRGIKSILLSALFR